VPILSTLAAVKEPLAALDLIMLALLIVSGYTTINTVVKAELFPTEVRALGVGLPYAITVSIFGAPPSTSRCGSRRKTTRAASTGTS
jgi:MFS transporter, MHS family, alpha-ketoglutarate permease